jgi:hypothetical protein
MTQPVRIALIAAVVLLAGTSAVLFQKFRTTSEQYADAKAAEEVTRNRYGEAINAIVEIQDSLNAVVLGDDQPGLADELSAERKLTQSKGNEALDRVAVLKAGVERTKQRINRLEASLKKTGVRISGMQKMIANLKRSVVEKEDQIAQLTGQVQTLETTVTGLSTEVQQKGETIRVQEEAIEQKRSELATVYYAVGSKKDLEKQGIVVAKGGVLGLGKTIETTGQFVAEKFTPLDTDQERVVRIPADKVEVVSDQPPSSYQLVAVGKEMELHIVDPQEFRKVKQLVIVTS